MDNSNRDFYQSRNEPAPRRLPPKSAASRLATLDDAAASAARHTPAFEETDDTALIASHSRPGQPLRPMTSDPGNIAIEQ